MDKKRILLVEDDEDVSDFLKPFLADNDYEMDVAIDGRSGLKKLGEFQPDLVILDLMMPGVDGFEFLKSLQAKPELKTAKILVVTAVQKVGGAEEALRLGADGYLMKPVDNDLLLEKIKDLLSS
ncbi:MAG TPA: response regulator [Elusimicrobiota bacterium]|nr:response regulator [Elusimicrobiota bacterium]